MRRLCLRRGSPSVGLPILGGCLTVVVGSVTVVVVAPPVSVAIEQRRCHGLTGCQLVVRFPTVSRLRFRVGVRSVRLALVPSPLCGTCCGVSMVHWCLCFASLSLVATCTGNRSKCVSCSRGRHLCRLQGGVRVRSSGSPEVRTHCPRPAWCCAGI